jgi:DICT domain-containing protein
VPLRRSTKPLLIQVSKALEREAARLGPAALVLATFQTAGHFTQATADRFEDLARRVGFVAALGTDIAAVPAAGVRGADLDPTDPLCQEWDLIVLSPHFAAALLARDLGDTGPDASRRFDFALTYDRRTVVAAAHALLSRVRAVRSGERERTPLAA